MKEKTLKAIKTSMVILFFLFYSSIISYMFKYFKIDISSFNNISLTFIYILIDLLEMLILFFIYYDELKKEFKTFKNNFKNNFKLGIKWWLIGLLLMYISNIIIYIFVKDISSNEALVQEEIMKLPFYMLFQTSIVAPFNEEIVFRKSLKDIINNKYLYIILSFLIFGGLHVLSSSNILGLLYIIPYGIFGGIFAYLYVKTETIFTSISMHFIHNTLFVSISIITLFLGV